jgi:ferric-dicitrate binding protein FerR (iron transport regulator)
MTGKYIPAVIKSFFGNRASEELQHKFHKWFTDGELQSEKQEAMQDIWDNCTAASDAQTLPELKKLRKRIRAYENSRRRRFTRLAGAAAIFLLPVLSAVLTYHLKQDTVVVREPEYVEYFVPPGDRKHIILPDGSEVWVNSGSLLIAEKEFSGAARTLYLNGEANFSVAPGQEKPFIVKTEYMDITAIGTTFNVQSYPDAGKTVATLESGKVRISARRAAMQSEVVLSPNEQLVYNRITDELTTRKVAADKNSQWIQGFMIFQSSSFEEIARTIERKFRIRVQYPPNKFKGRIFTVRFSPDENISQVFGILKEIGGFQYRIEDSTVYIN